MMPKQSGKKLNARCQSCNYVFFTARFPRLCPYCGKEGTVVDNGSGGAQRIVDEVSQWEDREKRF